MQLVAYSSFPVIVSKISPLAKSANGTNTSLTTLKNTLMSKNTLPQTQTSSRGPPHGLLNHDEFCGTIYAKESKVEKSYF